jgi:hypothetical protein
VRCAIAFRENLSSELIQKFVEDEYEDIRQLVADQWSFLCFCAIKKIDTNTY